MTVGLALPSGWEMLPLKRLASLRSGRGITAERIEAEGDYPVFGGNGVRGYTDTRTHEGTYALIGRQGALCGNINVATGPFYASEHAVVVTPIVDAPIGWLSRLLEWANFGSLSQTAAQPGLAVSELNNVTLPVPPASERLAIAHFLDRETAQIDDMIEAQRELVAVAEARRQAVLTDTVFQGVGSQPGSSHPSGSRYQPVGFPPLALARGLSLVPEDWDIVRFKVAMQRVEERNGDGEATLMSLTSAGRVVPRSETGDRQQPAEESVPRYLMVRPGRLIINPMWLTGGAIGVSWTTGAVSPDYRVFRSRGHHDPRYLHHLLRAPAYLDQYRLYTRAQTTFDRRVQQPDIDSLPLPVPTLGEQADIAAHLDRATARIDAVIDAANESIALMRERRAALVSDAVTGRIDPRTGLERGVQG